MTKSRAILQAELVYQNALADSHAAKRALAIAEDQCSRLRGEIPPDEASFQYWVDQETIARGKALAIQAELDGFIAPSELYFIATGKNRMYSQEISLSQIIELCRDALKAPQP